MWLLRLLAVEKLHLCSVEAQNCYTHLEFSMEQCFNRSKRQTEEKKMEQLCYQREDERVAELMSYSNCFMQALDIFLFNKLDTISVFALRFLTE